MTAEQEKLFQEYVTAFEAGEQIKRVEYQKQLYENVIERGLENTGVGKLLEMTNDEIQRQYMRKEQFENRAGFLLALWGIVFGVVVNRNMIAGISTIASNYMYSYVDIFLSFLMIIFGVISIFYICKCLIGVKIYHFEFNSQENNFDCAGKDRDLFYIVALTGLSDVWKLNEDMITKKRQ